MLSCSPRGWRPTHAKRLVLLAAIAIASAGCAAQRAPAPAPYDPGAYPRESLAMGERVADIATSMVGVPYRFGGDDPAGFDCSGLVHYAYRRVGIAVPRTAREQRARARPVGIRSVRRGDLLFFDGSAKSGHVGIYLGNRRFVHAPSSGKRVTIGRLDAGYFASRLAGAARLH